MAYYVLLWNPKKDPEFPHRVAAWKEDHSKIATWSCGHALGIVPRDRVILRRTGSGERGVVGLGEVVQGSHDDGQGGHAVKIKWDCLSENPIVEQDDPALSPFTQLWTAQAGGTKLADDDGKLITRAVRRRDWSFLPIAKQFIQHWTAHEPTDNQKRMLVTHYWSPDPGMHPGYIARCMEWASPSASHLHYGGFAGTTADAMGVEMEDRDAVSLFAAIWGPRGDTRWEMHDQVREAIRHMGWHRLGGPVLDDGPDRDLDRALFRENQRMQKSVTYRGRSASVRERCLDVHQPVCWVCELDPVARFGSKFRGLIDVHHLDPMAESDEERMTDPKRDCRPLCPNCHRLAHHGMPAGTCRSIDELKLMMGRT